MSHVGATGGEYPRFCSGFVDRGFEWEPAHCVRRSSVGATGGNRTRVSCLASRCTDRCTTAADCTRGFASGAWLVRYSFKKAVCDIVCCRHTCETTFFSRLRSTSDAYRACHGMWWSLRELPRLRSEVFAYLLHRKSCSPCSHDFRGGAGNGNRTHIFCLEGRCHSR